MKLQRYIMCVLCALALQANATDNYPKNPNIDIDNYRFALTLSDDSDVIRGEAEISVLLKKDGVESLRFDLIGKSENMGGKGMIVSVVMVNGTPANFNHAGDALSIQLAKESRKEGPLKVTIVYAGIPATGLIIGPNKHGDRTFFSDNWPNKVRNWLPAVDHPYDKATCEFLITAPDHYQVISNGLLIETTNLPSSQKLSHWKQSVPIATWLYALGVAEFAVQYVEEFEGKSIQTWVYKQDRDSGFYNFAIPTKDVMAFYSDYVGPYAYEKLANVQANSIRGGGMEAATAIFYHPSSVTGDRTERWRNVIIHEVAHQWFGNAVTEYDWDDVWLSEGFATYFTLLYIEHAYGRDEFVEGLKSARDKVYQFYKDNPDYRIVHDNLDDMSKVSTIQTYQKGAWILHMLRNNLGDKAFETGIKSYYRKYFNINATTADFKTEMELASGQNLDAFFKQWLYQGGNVELKGSWSYNSKMKKITIDLAQVQKDYSFSVPVEIAIYRKEGEKPDVQSVVLDKHTGKFEFTLDSAPLKVELDPNTKLLATWEFSRK
ncbi:MAG: M1 family metallopeptidase [Cyclobacteriaceae bacterium]